MSQPTEQTPHREIILLKQGELVLKGLNRRGFEDKLLGNARKALRPHGEFHVYARQSTVYVEPKNADCNMDAAYEALSKLFGVAGLSRAHGADKNVEAILEAAKSYLGAQISAAQSFKVETKRADKSFPLSSIQISQQVGGGLHDAFSHVAVDVHNPAICVQVEIRETAAYVHANPTPGAGGLPVGMGGRAVSLLSGGIDSPVASWMMAKRGVSLDMIHFFSHPYTSQEAKDKVLTLARLLTPWCGKLYVHVVPFTDIQERLMRECPEELFTVLMRRFMMRIAEGLAQKLRAKGLITGESLGQVASQTMDAMLVTGAVCSLPVMRPLIGMDKTEIVSIARRIGTFETSILPYEDCCTVFTPRHPRTKPTLEEVELAEKDLPIEEMVQAALAGIERVIL